MTQSNALSHHRRTPSGSNGSKLKTTRPSFHRKGASFVNHSISKLGSGQVRSIESEEDPLPEMASSFLNFCAMCERQITVPDNTLLYCSESCRRKDSHKPLSASFPSCSPMSSASNTPPASPPLSPRIIVAPLTPTKASVKSAQITRIPFDMHDAKTDQDPSEWKPVIPMDSRCATLMTSDAWKYLSQFHSDDSILPLRRSRVEHRSSASLSTLMTATAPLPSLSHTPSSIASSLNSDASDYMSHVHDSTRRPLPPRHNPYFWGTGNAAKGVELVVPHIVVAADGSPLDMPKNVFPASTGLWDDHYKEKPRSITTLKTASPAISLESKEN